MPHTRLTRIAAFNNVITILYGQGLWIFLEYVLCTSHARINGINMEKTMECEIPLWKARASIESIKKLARTSRSGIVPPMPPQVRALLPIFLARAISPTAAANTIWDNEFIRHKWKPALPEQKKRREKRVF